jgi:hypothetical protein
MSKRRIRKQEVITTISVARAMDSVGILGLKLLQDMETIDPNDWYDMWLHMKDNFELALLVMAEAENKYKALFRVLMIELPDGIGAIEVKNPLNEDKEKERPSKKDDAQSSDLGFDTIIDGDLPF